jgi:hypothetical protein
MDGELCSTGLRRANGLRLFFQRVEDSVVLLRPVWGIRRHSHCYTNKWPPLWSSCQSSWLHIERPRFDSRRYQIFWEVVGLERDPLSLVSTTEKLILRNNSGSGLENRDLSQGIHGVDYATPLYPQKLPITSPKAAVARSVLFMSGWRWDESWMMNGKRLGRNPPWHNPDVVWTNWWKARKSSRGESHQYPERDSNIAPSESQSEALFPANPSRATNLSINCLNSNALEIPIYNRLTDLHSSRFPMN